MTERDWHAMNEGQEAGDLILGSLMDIFNDWGVESIKELGDTIYGEYECGPWLSVKKHDGEWVHTGELDSVKPEEVRSLLVGSIVEGSDAEVVGRVIDLLYTEDAALVLDAELGDVNDEACRIWEECNQGEAE